MAGPGRPTVLIVDDEPNLTDTHAQYLSGKYDVRKAYSGAEALERLDEEVAVTLLDRKLPNSSSDDILEGINERHPECRTALVTGVTPDFDILEMEFDDYVVKPVGKAELRNTVEQMLARSDYQELLREYFALLSKYATLKTHKPETELEESPEFVRLEAQVERRRSELDELTAEFEPEDFQLLCREIAP
ncbi:MAG: HalX domain-containing protein [Halobacteriales archaeon]